MKLSERVSLDTTRKKSNGNPYFFLPVSMVTGFDFILPKTLQKSLKMDYICTVAASKIYIFMSYCKLFFQVLLRIKSTASL